VIATQYGFGLDVKPGTFFAQHLEARRCWEQDESELIRSLVRPGDICVDAGAHVGYFACLMASCGARVLAFEPNPEIFKMAVKNCVGFDVQLAEVALSDVSGEAVFHLPSTFNDGWGSLAAADEAATGKVTFVRTDRLENMLPSGRIRLIKMDVEGAEVQALRGLGERLTDVDYLLIECVDIPPRVAALGSTVEGINELLAEFIVFDFIGSTWESVKSARSKFENSFLFAHPRTLGLEADGPGTWKLGPALAKAVG
jgi:FkbM family methyltransferase